MSPSCLGGPEAARRPGPGAILRSHLQDPRRQWTFHPWRSSATAVVEPWRRMPNLSGITAERSKRFMNGDPQRKYGYFSLEMSKQLGYPISLTIGEANLS